MSFNQHEGGEDIPSAEVSGVMAGLGTEQIYSPETGQQRDSVLSATVERPHILDKHLEIQEQGKKEMEQLYLEKLN